MLTVIAFCSWEHLIKNRYNFRQFIFVITLFCLGFQIAESPQCGKKLSTK